jgi:hypothetical protein
MREFRRQGSALDVSPIDADQARRDGRHLSRPPDAHGMMPPAGVAKIADANLRFLELTGGAGLAQTVARLRSRKARIAHEARHATQGELARYKPEMQQLADDLDFLTTVGEKLEVFAAFLETSMSGIGNGPGESFATQRNLAVSRADCLDAVAAYALRKAQS